MDILPECELNPPQDRGNVLIIRILAIEDDAAVRTLIELILTKQLPCAKTVEFAGDWSAAWALLQRRRYNVVLLDLALPDSSPEETVNRIPEILQHADAVCVVTGTGERFREASIAIGAFEYFEKPAIAFEKRRGFIDSIVHAIQRRNPSVAAQNLIKLKEALKEQQS